MKIRNIDRVYAVWREQALLTQAEIDRLDHALDASQRMGHGKAVVIFSTVGAFLIGIGAILFVSSHWGTMGPLVRFGLVAALYGLSVGAAHLAERRNLPLFSEGLWFLATLVLGAEIFLLGQVFNFTLTYWQGPLLWATGALVMGWARQQAIYGWLVVLLGTLALGWLGGGSGWFFDDQVEFLVSDRGLLPLFPLVGLAFLSCGGLLRRYERWSFMRPACTLWGMGLMAVPLVVATIDDDIVRHVFAMDLTSTQAWIIAGSVIIILGFAFWGAKSKMTTVFTLLLLVGLASLCFQDDRGSHLGVIIAKSSWAFGSYVLMVFISSLAATGLGVLERSPGLVHTGLVSVVTIIVIQYFSHMDLFEGALTFIIGGVVLLAVGYGFARSRRYLLTKMEAV